MIKFPTREHERFILYADEFFAQNKMRGLLKGSLAAGTANPYSDIDLVVKEAGIDLIKEFIFAYAKIALLSTTERPKGILVVIYENGLCIDLDIRKTITNAECQNGIVLGRSFNKEDISDELIRCEKEAYIIKESAENSESEWEKVQRLFHRSLIKYLGGKTDVGYDILWEIQEFLGHQQIEMRRISCGYQVEFFHLYQVFCKNYPVNEAYKNVMEALMKKL